jgi:peptidoglycan/LPS O-acetylase OafA/YrhL
MFFTRKPVYFLLFVLITLGFCRLNEVAHQGVLISYLNPPLTVKSSAADIVDRFVFCDPASYVKGARLYFSDTDPRSSTVIKVWAPGFPFVEALLLQISEHRFARVLFWFTALVWGLCLAACGLLLRELSGSLIFPFIVFACFGLHLVRDYLLMGGILYSETLGIAILMPSLLLFCRAVSRRSWRDALVASVGLLAVAFLRSQFLLAIECGLGLLAASFIATAVYEKLKTRRLPSLPWRELGIAVLLFVVAIGSYSAWNDGEFVHNEFMYDLPWRPVQNPPDMYDAGGMGVLCDVDRPLCARLRAQDAVSNAPDTSMEDAVARHMKDWQDNRAAVVHTILHHPLPVLQRKLHYFIKYFYSAPLSIPSTDSDFTYLYGENTLFALLSIGGLLGCLAFRRNPYFQTLGILTAGMWAGSVVVCFVVLHFEVRYLFFGKLLGFITCLAVAAELCRRFHAEYILPQTGDASVHELPSAPPAKFYPEVESLRGLAACVVLVGHYKLMCFDPETGPISVRLSSAQHMFSWFMDYFFQPQPSVLLFFVISGFVLAIQLQRQPVVNLSTYLAYLVRRCFRLLPAMWGTIVLAYIVLRPTGYLTAPHPGLMLRSMLFEDDTLDLPLWTMGVEMTCSVIFPLLFWLHSKLPSSGKIGLLAVLAAVPTLGDIPGIPKLPLSTEFVVFFEAGLLVGAALPHLTGFQRPRRAVPLLIVAALTWMLAPQFLTAGFNQNRWQAWMWLEIPACFLILAIVAAQGEHRFIRLLRSAAARHLGRISYSLYLLHYVIGIRTLTILQKKGMIATPGWLLWFAGAGILSLLLATLMFKYVEQPGIRLGRHLAARLLAKPLAQSPAVV